MCLAGRGHLWNIKTDFPHKDRLHANQWFAYARSGEFFSQTLQVAKGTVIKLWFFDVVAVARKS